MTWINSDDILSPNSLQLINTILTDYPFIEWTQGRSTLINQDSSSIGVFTAQKWARKDYLRKNYKYIQQEGSFWTRKLYEKAGNFISQEYNWAGDLELWNSFFKYSQLQSVNVILGSFRKHKGQKTDFMDKYDAEAEKIIDIELQNYLGNIESELEAPEPIQLKNVHAVTQVPLEKQKKLLEKVKNLLDNGKIIESRTYIRELFNANPDELQYHILLSEVEKSLGNRNFAKIILWNSNLTMQQNDRLLKLLADISFEDKDFSVSSQFYSSLIKNLDNNSDLIRKKIFSDKIITLISIICKYANQEIFTATFKEFKNLLSVYNINLANIHLPSEEFEQFCKEINNHLIYMDFQKIYSELRKILSEEDLSSYVSLD